MSLHRTFAATMEALVVAGAWPGAVAVSGGGDSLALMLLLADWAQRHDRPPPIILTVDHRLRDRSGADARQVVRWAKAAGLEAHILVRQGLPPCADIEAVAREARYRLMGAWAKRRKIPALYLGHTQDDQAETFLLRLGRGSGLDGLAGMRLLGDFPLPGFADVRLARPLLAVPRATLRADLTARGHAWLEDPMNDEARFARVRIRGLADQLAAAGISPRRIADAAAHLARAREALEHAMAGLLADASRREGLADASRVEDGAPILLDPARLVGAPREVGLRALAHLLMQVSGRPYRPRFDALERLYDKMAGGGLAKAVTLHGCRLGAAPRPSRLLGPKTLMLTREGSRGRAGRVHPGST